MAELPPTSVGIEYDGQYYDSTLSTRSESLKSTIVTQKKRLFYHQEAQLIRRRVQKHH